jgi:hypothetical protein
MNVYHAITVGNDTVKPQPNQVAIVDGGKCGAFFL